MAYHTLDISEICRMVTGFPLDKVVVFDTETTGVDTSMDEVLSIAACDGYGNKLISTKVRPVRHSSWPEAQRVNGISPQMVKDAPTIAELRPKLREILLGDVLLVGYNVQFDINMLWSNGVLDDYPPHDFDVMQQYATVHGSGKKRYCTYRYSKLSVCAEHYGYTFHAHDSMEDAMATLLCFRALICDDKWLHATMDGKAKQMRTIVTSQTKATAAAVEDLVAGGMGTDSAAELRLGEITRGKNKGSKRYELYSNGALVGTLTTKDTERAKTYLMADDGEELPSPVRCSATLAVKDGTARAAAEISERRNVIRAMYGGAKLARERGSCQWRTIQKQEPAAAEPAKSVPSVQEKHYTNPLAVVAAFFVLAFLMILIFQLF